MSQYLSLRKAAAMLGVHHATLSRAVRRGELAPDSVTPGGFMRFSQTEIERYRTQRLRRNSSHAISETAGNTGLFRHSEAVSSASIDRLLESIPDMARRLVRAQYAAMAIMDSRGEIVRFITSGITPEARRAIGELPRGRGLLGVIFHEGKSIRIPDISKHPRSVGFPPNHPPMKSFLGVPILLDGENLGNLYLTNKQGAEEFSQYDQEVVEMLALSAASAVLSARLFMREAQLRREAELERARLHAVIESSPAAVVIVDATDGRILLANQAASRLIGVQLSPGDSLEKFEKAAVRRRPDGTPSETSELPLRRALTEGITTRGLELVFDLPDGRRIPTVVNAAPVRDEMGSTTAAIAVFDDITELQEVERLKAEFLSMVSHDLRGPLATIKGLSSSLLMEMESGETDNVREYVTSIDEETDRMVDLVGNLLDMSRIEARAMPMDMEVCHLADIVADSVSRMRRSRTGAGDRVAVDVPLELPEVYADYDQVGRVVSNLLSNALKYSPPDTTVTVRSYLDPGDSQVVITEVRDQGFGIPEEEKGKIFTKFYRVTSQRGRARPGSGLGLAICKSIVEAHGGRIWFESEQGRGSAFYFSLPAAVVGVGL